MVEVVKAAPKPPSKFLILGEPFTGKTTLASKAPAPLFMSTDGNAAKAGLDAVNISDRSDILETIKLFKDSNKYKTLVIDTIEGVADIFKNDILNRYRKMGARNSDGNPIESLNDIGYGKGTAALNEQIQAFSEVLSRLDKNVIVLSYTKRQVDEATNTIVLSSELKNIRLITRYMDAQILTTFDGEVYKQQLISKREIVAGNVDYSEIKDFLDLIGWNGPKKKVKIGKAQRR